MALNDWETRGMIADRNRLQLKMQDNRNQMQADAVQSAHDRFMQGRRNFMESNPNAVSNFERNAVLGRAQQLEDRGALRQHELRMLNQQGQNELAVAEQKRLGMVDQGANAARAKAAAEIRASENLLAGKRYEVDANKEVELDRNRTTLTTEEKKLAGALAVEKERQAGALDVAEEQGRNAVNVEREKGVAAKSTLEAQRLAQERLFEQQQRIQILKNNGKNPSAEETKAFVRMRQDARYKNMTDSEIWGMLSRGGSEE